MSPASELLPGHNPLTDNTRIESIAPTFSLTPPVIVDHVPTVTKSVSDLGPQRPLMESLEKRFPSQNGDRRSPLAIVQADRSRPESPGFTNSSSASSCAPGGTTMAAGMQARMMAVHIS